jgi:type I restriction enzyme S subunit
VGSLAEIKLFMGGNGCIAQNVVALRNDYISLFLYDYLNRIKSDLVAYNIGSVQPSIKVTHIIKHKIILPQADVLDKYISLSRKLTENIYNYSYEIDNLSSLRDELLPKLMSGELNVENVNF